MLALLLHGRDSCGYGASSPPHSMLTTQLFCFWDGLNMENFCCFFQASRAGEKAPQTLLLTTGMKGTTALHRVIIAGCHKTLPVQKTVYFTASSVLTRPPQLYALVFIREAHATVAIRLSSIAGSPIDLVRVGGAKW